ncbi:hypothetical protein [Pedobacter cryotolerans]|uniref:Por secretion system C-terminal sorting domain-containing protein n=1 Tax=Pedobacter cryotolerans TaxID=2571270 RepID=A0A4U1BUZ4_9SPHI|nr:hypothetical protein [Pedobacter cryotolerans]TKB96552.1 hypothetical protein FA045_17990 [Pedobacter cryotolerans]
MKNLLKNSLILALVLISSIAFADDANISVKVKAENEKSIIFSLDQAEKINLSIYSLNDGIIYEQNIKTDKATTKTYNLEAFPDGNYIIKLENEEKLIEYQVNIFKGKTLISEPIVTEFFKPILVKDEDFITIDMKYVPHGEVEVKVFNEYNDEMYAKSFASKVNAVKKFNISKTDAKQLTFLIRSKNHEFIETVVLR